MNEIKIFSNPQFGEIEAIEQEFAEVKSNGWVYALEYGDMVKIGCSSKPSKRYAHLIHNGADYAGLKMGKFALSKSCVNYRELETRLHKQFASYRKEGTELFSISFGEAVKAIETLEYDLDFVSADAQIKESFEGLKTFVTSFMNGQLEDTATTTSEDVNSDPSMQTFLGTMEDYKSRLWFSVEDDDSYSIGLTIRNGNAETYTSFSKNEAIALAATLLDYASKVDGFNEEETR